MARGTTAQHKDIYADFYDSHRATQWNPVTSSRGIPKLPLPVLIPCEESKSEGRIYYHALNPYRIAELPVRQLNPHELLRKQSPLWQEHLQDTIKLVNAIENDKGLAKIIHEQFAKTSKEQEAHAQQNPWSHAAAMLNSGLFHPSTQLVVWWSDRYSDRDRRLKAGIYCPNPRAAAFALLLGIGSKRTIKIGLCPKCGKEFSQDEWHPSSYCSPKCRNAASQAAFRARRTSQRKRKAVRTRLGR
jgi:hypothetical protein